ncbi:MAG: TrkH family potassium uptake protein [Muribaculaceae bacterium]|nr:TrkH family potassium uptake protein [Muribaculaceae bacterium]
MKSFLKAVNTKAIIRMIGYLIMIEGFFMLWPMVASLLWDEPDWQVFAWVAGGCIVGGFSVATFVKPREKDMGKRDGFLMTSMVWVAFAVFGMIPFLFCDTPLSLSDAFFEAMSGFTTTGASVMNSVSHLSHGIMLWRAEMNWIGGMGIILFTLAVTPMFNQSSSTQLFNAEVTGITHEKLRPRVSATALGMWGVYGSLTLILFGLLWLGPMDLFDSICYAFSTISTGGFSTHDGSITVFNSLYIDVVIMVFMFLGGINFALIYKGSHGNFKALFKNDVFRTFCRLILIIYVVFVIAIVFSNRFNGLRSVTIDPLFMVISTITSTGLTVADFENWGPLCISLLFVMMFFGACAGSTSGGAKLDRIIVLYKSLRNEVYRLIHPNSIMTVRINDKVYSESIVSKVIAFLCLYVFVIVSGGIILTAMGVPVMDAFFSAFSCIGNTGLGAGITGYGGGYDLLPDAAKWVLAFIMLIGRLEIFTVLIILTRGFWSK